MVNGWYTCCMLPHLIPTVGNPIKPPRVWQHLGTWIKPLAPWLWMWAIHFGWFRQHTYKGLRRNHLHNWFTTPNFILHPPFAPGLHMPLIWFSKPLISWKTLNHILFFTSKKTHVGSCWYCVGTCLGWIPSLWEGPRWPNSQSPGGSSTPSGARSFLGTVGWYLEMNGL